MSLDERSSDLRRSYVLDGHSAVDCSTWRIALSRRSRRQNVIRARRDITEFFHVDNRYYITSIFVVVDHTRSSRFQPCTCKASIWNNSLSLHRYDIKKYCFSNRFRLVYETVVHCLNQQHLIPWKHWTDCVLSSSIIINKV